MNIPIKKSSKFFRIFMIVFMIVSVMFAVTPVGPAYAATFTVDSNNDGTDVLPGDGICDADPGAGFDCTLRAAIEEANFANDLDTINFSVPMTITPGSNLPTISENVTIDGSVGAVNIDFSGVAGDGFVITASNVTIRALNIYDGPSDGIYVNGGSNVTIENNAIHGFGQYAVLIDGGATSVLIDSNYLGVLSDGSTPDGNGFRGVRITDSPTNSITNNVISDNGTGGIWISGVASDGNIIKGNYIGLNSTGTASIPNSGNGIYIQGAPNTQIGGGAGADRNYISGNTGNGVYITGASDGSAVQGNYIGTDKVGENARANTSQGVYLNGTTSVTVGGGTGNLISGNGSHGVYILNAPAANTVQNNTIGLDVDGDTALANSGNGVYLSNSDNTSVSGNTISKNTLSGVLIDGGSTGTNLQTNRIGISRSGALSLGNSNDGVEIAASPDNVINNNTIAYNTGDGISITGGASTANTITSNSIYSNGGLGIDLNDNGVTVNDGAGDPDAGPNTYQNFPLITSAAIEGSGVRVIGYLESGDYATRGDYSLQFFHQTVCDGSGYGQGSTLMRTQAVSLPGLPDPAPNRYDFNILIDPFGASFGDFITVTATYDAGAGGLEDTSEFSPCATIPPSSGVFVVNSLGDGADAGIDGVCDDGAGNCTLRAAIQEVNGGASPPYTIAFNVSGPFTITLGSSLPIITNQVIIDGTSQPGYVTPVVTVDGNGAAATGFSFNASSSELRGLSIVGFTGSAVFINSGISGTTVEDNYIGLRTNGTTADGNQTGIYVSGGSSNLILDNVISSNTNGVRLVGSAAQANVVQGNYIGTDAGGTADRGNTTDGIRVSGGQSNIIGGSGAGQKNIISGNNGDGIEMSGGGAGGNLVYGNYIGVQVDGTSSLGNSGYGIKIDAMSNNLISNGNVIANNGTGGVLVTFISSSANLISQNSIYSNTGLGITLSGGANNSQSAPLITDAKSSPGAGYTLVDGTLTGFTPNSTFTIEFFSNPSTGTEGKTYWGSSAVSTDGAGSAAFSVSILVELILGERVTTTATGPSNNTSQISLSQAVIIPGIPLPSLTPTTTVTPTSTSTFTPTNTSAPTNTNPPAPTNTLAGGGSTNTPASTNTPSPTGPTSTFTPLGGAPAITLTAMAAADTLAASGATVTGTPPTATGWWASSETPTPGGPTDTEEGDDGGGGSGIDTDTPTPTSTEAESLGISDADATATAQAVIDGEEGGGMSSLLWILIIIAVLILVAGGAMELIRWLNSREA